MTTASQAKNAIRRALLHEAGIRFSKEYKERCRNHFSSTCAYCGNAVDAGARAGHFDHASALAAGEGHFGLVFACIKCQTEKKIGKDWIDYLNGHKDFTPAQKKSRREKIEEWFRLEEPLVLSPALLSKVNAAQSAISKILQKTFEEMRMFKSEN